MTLSQLKVQFEYWRKHPPVHELVAGAVGFKPQLTVEEQWLEGAMGPADFAGWLQATKGRQVGPSG